jgi:hypothetical protein
MRRTRRTQLDHAVPARPKIYHIVHVDNLSSIVEDGCLWPDATMASRPGGTIIGRFLIEGPFPWGLVERVGVYAHDVGQRALTAMQGAVHRPETHVMKAWYY